MYYLSQVLLIAPHNLLKEVALTAIIMVHAAVYCWPLLILYPYLMSTLTVPPIFEAFEMSKLKTLTWFDMF